MDDRDRFAAAALTGLLASNTKSGVQDIVRWAWNWADLMLYERGNHPEKPDSSTIHDAAPAARANAESVAPQPTAGDRSGNPTSHSGTGNTSDRSKPINDDRLATLEQLSAMDQELELKHGITGNPMIKAQVNNHPVSYAKTDEKPVLYDTKRDTTQPRNGAPSNGPDPDSRVWETPRTPQPHATPPQGIVQGESSFRVSQNANEPVAWATFYPNGSTASVYLGRHPWHAEPLYRRQQPTITDEEREAVERGYCSLMGVEDMSAECTRWDAEAAATLRKLLERLG